MNLTLIFAEISVILLILTTPRLSHAQDGQIDQRIREIKSGSRLDAQFLADKESRILSLINSQSPPEEKGKVYAAIAFLYSDQGY